ncbi:MAG: VanZ family protein [Clostridia bacterium]|nr:VanZ family protein [Clostridia bacterium]MDR3643481.1 VanZ family protein [Clostridia bacterium]
MKKNRLLIILLAAWIIVIFSFSLRSGASSHSESSAVENALLTFLERVNIRVDTGIYNLYRPFVPKGQVIDAEAFVRKTAHVFEYAVLGLLCCANAWRIPVRRRRAAWLFFLIGPLTAMIDEEIIQRFLVTGRTSSLRDVLLDATGFFIAATIAMLCHLPALIRASGGGPRTFTARSRGL